MSSSLSSNPLLSEWKTSHGLPPFDVIESYHFEEAFDHAMSIHINEIESIVSCKDIPSFDNTILSYDKSGSILKKVSGVYSNLCSSLLTPDLQIIQKKMSPILTNHYNKVYTYNGLYDKINHIYNNRLLLNLDTVQIRFIEQVYNKFKRNGAAFTKEEQVKYGKIKEELSTLYTTFSQNVMKDEEEVFLELTDKDLDGLPDFLIESARSAATERKKTGYVITISRSLVVPFLTFSSRKDLRKLAYYKWISRGQIDPDRDNIQVIKRILQLRKAQATMHGFDNFSSYNLDDTMAKTTQNVSDLLYKVWDKAKISVERERKCLEEFIIEESNGMINTSNITIDNEDWRYYAEKVRAKKYEIEEVEVKKYFKLENMVEAVFDTASKLYGLRFVLTSLKAYHDDAKVYEVYQGNELIAIFIHDNYSRMYKSSGAWMSEIRKQSFYSSDGSKTIPIVLNNNNFAKGESATLLSFDDARTLFHEFGHGLHGMLSDVKYEFLASTSVLRDFVELPSQLMEHWYHHHYHLYCHKSPLSSSSSSLGLVSLKFLRSMPDTLKQMPLFQMTYLRSFSMLEISIKGLILLSTLLVPSLTKPCIRLLMLMTLTLKKLNYQN